MAYDSNRRLRSHVLRADYESLIAVQHLEGYTSTNADYTRDKLIAAHKAMEAARAAEIYAENALAAARHAAIKAEWEFHNAILGAKNQVVAQYGTDSDEVQAIGLKKKSERKRLSRRPATPGAE